MNNELNTKERKGWFEGRFEEFEGRHRFDCVACSKPMFFPKSKLGKYKTCGGECSTRMRESLRAERTKPCETCGQQFTPRPSQLEKGHGRYCSQKCNVASHTAVNAPDAQQRARASWKKTYQEGRMRIRTGEAHAWWTGGKAAAYKRVLAYQVLYRKRNPDKQRAWSSNRRAKAGGKVSGLVTRFLLNAQRNRCAVCRCSVSKGRYELDHIQPVSKGGKSDLGNLQILCPKCNRTKSAKDPIEFMQQKGCLL